jgi:2,4-dienoyl-CoA reductase-like NADH-dependent reductase (Old Yellow Enzyme family)
MPDFQLLFTPIRIGGVTAKNRICVSAHADALA